MVDPENPSVVYATTWLAGTWKSVDAGLTWNRIADFSGDGALLVMATISRAA